MKKTVIIYGNRPEEVLRDEEGMQTMRTLGGFH